MGQEVTVKRCEMKTRPGIAEGAGSFSVDWSTAIKFEGCVQKKV